MLSVSENFTSAELADVNKPVAKVYLILGNYATAVFGASASASGSDGSGDYPAAGAIDGDRTEINVGPASGADNDVGLSSWRSAVAPDTTPQTLTINMGQSRTVNRIKLYHLSSHALSSFKIESSPDNVTWTLVDKTTDQGGGIATTQEVDTIDFDDTTCQYLKLTISATVVAADKANVVEFEIYRLVDITDRVISCKTGRARDYQLSNSMAATANIVCSNTDKFFSPSYVPSSTETDFVNDELKPGIGLLVKYGFDYTGSQEYAQQFIGTIDKFTLKPGARTCTIEARDAMKSAFNKIVSTKLKTNQDVGDVVKYMLNQVNISTWETDVDTVNINIDYFFTSDETVIEVIRQLVEACGDANFYFTENGIATFRSYLNSTGMSHTDTAPGDFESGTLTNIDTTSDPGKITMKWFKVENWSDGDYSSNPAWTATTNGASVAWSINSEVLEAINPSSQFIRTPFSRVTGTWEFRCKRDQSSDSVVFHFMANSLDGRNGDSPYNGYSVSISSGGTLNLTRVQSGGINLGSVLTIANDTDWHTIRITRTSGGVISVYLDGILRISATDSTFSTSAYIAFSASFSFGVGKVSIDDVYYSPVVEASEAAATQGVFVSQTIDQGATIATEGIFQTTQIVPTDTFITWYTATSADGSTWDAYQPVTPGDAIASNARRYIRYKAVLDSSVYLVSPTITDVTINWTLGSGSVKYPTSVSYTFDESLNMDLDQIYADTVAGGTSIINSVGVKAQPLVLDGADSDVQWQGTTGTPPVDISVSNPLGITSGQTLTYRCVVDGGMDTGRMSGANPAAAAITFAGGGAGSWVFSSIHPTRPVLVITVSGTGTITNLQVQGKAFSSNDTFLEAVATDTDSIQEFGERETQISSKYILNSATAQSIATRIVSNLADPVTYTPQVKVRPTFSIQVGDRVTLEDDVLNISEDNIVIGVEHFMSANMTGGDAYTMLKLLKITT